MAAFAKPREAAISQLLDWSLANLRGGDEIGVLDFAESARWTLLPRPVEELAATQTQPKRTALDSGGTAWTPVIERVRRLPDTGCETVVWLLSDGQYPDYPIDQDTAIRVLQDAGIQGTSLLVPSHDIEVPDAWYDTFPEALCTSFDGSSWNQTALALGRAVAYTTHQRLVLRQ